jgi:hypothetical protein
MLTTLTIQMRIQATSRVVLPAAGSRPAAAVNLHYRDRSVLWPMAPIDPLHVHGASCKIPDHLHRSGSEQFLLIKYAQTGLFGPNSRPEFSTYIDASLVISSRLRLLSSVWRQTLGQ